MGRRKKLNNIVAFLFDVFDKVIGKTNHAVKDYWFVWMPDDYEPIKLRYENDSIVSALHRIHWQHVKVSNPYTNDLGRIETYFYPYFHTPRIRKRKLDVGHYILINNMATRIDNYEVDDEEIPDYFICEGRKKKHPPSVHYEGWQEPI